jgi:hypothetical protein
MGSGKSKSKKLYPDGYPWYYLKNQCDVYQKLNFRLLNDFDDSYTGYNLLMLANTKHYDFYLTSERNNSCRLEISRECRLMVSNRKCKNTKKSLFYGIANYDDMAVMIYVTICYIKGVMKCQIQFGKHGPIIKCHPEN